MEFIQRNSTKIVYILLTFKVAKKMEKLWKRKKKIIHTNLAIENFFKVAGGSLIYTDFNHFLILENAFSY